MNGGSFDGGLLNLTNWVGNAIMPILAALILALGIYKYSRGYHIDPYIAGTMGALSVSGLLRLLEVFTQQGSGSTQYWAALLSLANWIGNVILPVYGGIEITRAVLGVGGFFERLNIGDDWVRHFITAGMCVGASGLLRLFEHWISTGTGGVA
jgi:energy-converting hydrogenase Eha subunit B